MASLISKFKDLYRSVDYFYPVLVGIIILQLLYLPGIRLGVVTSLVILILAFKNLSRRILLFNSTINKMILLYLIYNTVSIIWFLFSGFPVSVFIAEWSNSILPVVFFYFALTDKNPDDDFYQRTLNALFISFIIGFVLWLLEPPFYRVFMDTTEGAGTDLLFFQSLFGLTATGALGFVGFWISAHIIFTSKGRRGKIALLVCMLAIILTFRRSAMLVLTMAILAMHFIGYFRFRFLRKRYFVLEAAFFYCVYLYVAENYGDFITDLVERGSMISEAFNERSVTWYYAFQYGNPIFGNGLGTFGHKAMEYSEVLIADGNYFKMFAEIGIIGTLLFMGIIITSLIYGFRDLKNKYLEVGIVFGLSVMAIGSNIFEYQSIVPVFWYAIGRLAIKNKVNRNENIKDVRAEI